jgi:hypothetical protein
MLERRREHLVAGSQIQSIRDDAERLAGAVREEHLVGIAAAKCADTGCLACGFLHPTIAAGETCDLQALNLARSIFVRHGDAPGRTADGSVEIRKQRLHDRLRAHPLPQVLRRRRQLG